MANWFTPQTPDLEVQGFKPIMLFPWTKNFTPLCLSSPRCINGYQRRTAGVSPFDGLTSHPEGSSNTPRCFILMKPK